MVCETVTVTHDVFELTEVDVTVADRQRVDVAETDMVTLGELLELRGAESLLETEAERSMLAEGEGDDDSDGLAVDDRQMLGDDEVESDFRAVGETDDVRESDVDPDGDPLVDALGAVVFEMLAVGEGVEERQRLGLVLGDDDRVPLTDDVGHDVFETGAERETLDVAHGDADTDTLLLMSDVTETDAVPLLLGKELADELEQKLDDRLAPALREVVTLRLYAAEVDTDGVPLPLANALRDALEQKLEDRLAAGLCDAVTLTVGAVDTEIVVVPLILDVGQCVALAQKLADRLIAALDDGETVPLGNAVIETDGVPLQLRSALREALAQ